MRVENLRLVSFFNFSMTVRAIVEYPAAVLLTPGDAVVNFDAELKSLVQDMFETMYDDGGVGLAAQQIGVSLRLFVMDCDGIKLVAANPEIISVEGEQGGEEGCLSVGKVHAELKRPESARAASAGRQRAKLSSVKRADWRRVASSTRLTTATAYSSSVISVPLRRDLVLRKFRKLTKSK